MTDAARLTRDILRVERVLRADPALTGPALARAVRDEIRREMTEMSRLGVEARAARRGER